MGWKPVTACELCLAGGTAAQGPAFCQKLRTCRPVDGAVHSASAQKAGIGRVGNGVHSKRCDISLDDGEAGGGRFLSLTAGPGPLMRRRLRTGDKRREEEGKWEFLEMFYGLFLEEPSGA